MHQASVRIALKLDYKEIPVPDRIIIQLEPGELKLLRRIRYRQHDTDPLSAIKLSMKYGLGNHLQIAMQLTGGIVLNPGGEFKFAGTRLVLSCKPVIADQKLRLQKATIKEIEFPLLPWFLKAFARAVVNKSFLPNLGKSLNFNLETMLDEIRRKINALEPMELNIGNQKFHFCILPNVEDGAHELILYHDGIYLNLDLEFSPRFEIQARR
jgi:hypothetical protein